VVAGPLVETKLFLPKPRGDAVARLRLAELLDRGRRARLTLVSAAAEASARSRGCPWRRLTASPRGSGPTWAPQSNGRCPKVDDSALALLQTRQPALDSVLATLINELSAAPTP
jgi:LuxR family maltose regulon positive regulatory protein